MHNVNGMCAVVDTPHCPANAICRWCVSRAMRSCLAHATFRHPSAHDPCTWHSLLQITVHNQSPCEVTSPRWVSRQRSMPQAPVPEAWEVRCVVAESRVSSFAAHAEDTVISLHALEPAAACARSLVGSSVGTTARSPLHENPSATHASALMRAGHAFRSFKPMEMLLKCCMHRDAAASLAAPVGDLQ